jgi:hypothetical protein
MPTIASGSFKVVVLGGWLETASVHLEMNAPSVGEADRACGLAGQW